MLEKFQLSKASLIRMMDALLPNPDDPGNSKNPFGPYGPGGPRMSDLFELYATQRMLRYFSTEPWQNVHVRFHLGPQPDPWITALTARSAIEQLIAQYNQVQLTVSKEQEERSLEFLRGQMNDLIDDWCGTRPRPWPIPVPYPWPWPDPDPYPYRTFEFKPLDLLIIGAQFQKMSDYLTNHPLQADFTKAADRLLETGLERINQVT